MELKEIAILTALAVLFVLICKNFFGMYINKRYQMEVEEYNKNMSLLNELKIENAKLFSETDVNKLLTSAMRCLCLSTMLRKSPTSKQLVNDYKNVVSVLYWHINQTNNKSEV